VKDLNGRDSEERAVQEAFRLRMENQCDLIERYRSMVLQQQHRRLSRDEAALEWIERYAECFSSDSKAI